MNLEMVVSGDGGVCILRVESGASDLDLTADVGVGIYGPRGVQVGGFCCLFRALVTPPEISQTPSLVLVPLIAIEWFVFHRSKV